MERLNGIGVSPGVAVGRAVILTLRTEAIRFEIPKQEKVGCPTYDGAYPEWRTIASSWLGDRTGVFAMGPAVLPGLAKLQAIQGKPAEFKFAGARKPALFTFPDAEPRIEGLVMPVRTEATEVDEAA